MKRTLTLLFTVLLTACMISGCGHQRPDDEIVRDIISYGGSQDQERMQACLDELMKQNNEKGELWKEITDYWDSADTNMLIHTDHLPDDLPDDDRLALVVLGYALEPDGGMKDELIERLKVALKCAEQYPHAYVVCTGGGTASKNRSATEADKMGEWLLGHGLEKERLIIENRSLTTTQNAVYTYQILRRDYPQVDSAAIISSSYHIAWGALMFEAVFLKGASETGAPEMHVISNCACEIENTVFGSSDLLRWQSSGLTEISQTDLSV